MQLRIRDNLYVALLSQQVPEEGLINQAGVFKRERRTEPMAAVHITAEGRSMG